MKKALLVVLLFVLMLSRGYAAQSVITEAEGYACQGEDKSRRQTEQAATADAKRKAVEQVSTYVTSETEVKDFTLQKDLVQAYSRATVKVVQEIEKGWYRDTTLGDCYRIKVKVEVIPDGRAMATIAKGKAADDPSAPLYVQVWTDKHAYESGEKVKVYLKGNKPFYATILYKDAGGKLLQLLPNPHRKDNYFNGGVVYEVPAGNDRFDLEVTPPFGEEQVIVFAGTTPLGEVDIAERGGLFEVKTRSSEVAERTRGVKLISKSGNTGAAAAEFFEGKATLKTGGGKL
jgi:hypothetical protein